MLTQADIATHLDLTQQAISDLISRKILPRQKGGPVRTLDEYRVAYVRHLRAMAAGRLGDDGSLDLVNERARLAKEMADSQAMKNDQRRREVVEVAAAVALVGDAFAIVRTRLLSIPSGHAAQIARLKTPQEVQAALYALLVAALEELSSGKAERLVERAGGPPPPGPDASDEPEAP